SASTSRGPSGRHAQLHAQRPEEWQRLDTRCRQRGQGSHGRCSQNRIDPFIILTALAMIIGMVPMALGLGEGGEPNAPLGRAVIGGLVVATFFTLFFVPVMYSVLRRKPPAPETPDEPAAEPLPPAHTQPREA